MTGDGPESDRPAIRRSDDAEAPRWAMRPDPESARIRFARARADAHSARELYFLELAVRAPDDDSARQLEIYAHAAYEDAQAVTKEHDLDS